MKLGQKFQFGRKLQFEAVNTPNTRSSRFQMHWDFLQFQWVRYPNCQFSTLRKLPRPDRRDLWSDSIDANKKEKKKNRDRLLDGDRAIKRPIHCATVQYN